MHPFCTMCYIHKLVLLVGFLIVGHRGLVCVNVIRSSIEFCDSWPKN